MENKPLSLLFLTADPFPPFRVDITVLFGKEIVLKGHKVDWLFQSGRACSKFYQTQWAGGRAWIAKKNTDKGFITRLSNHFFNLKNDLQIFFLPRHYKYNFIQVKDKFFSAILAIIACKFYRTKFIFWLSYPFPEAWVEDSMEASTKYPIIRLIRGILSKVLLYNIILPLSEHIFVQSEQMKKDIAQKGIPKEKMTVVPMGIDLKQIPNFPEETNVSKGKEKNVVFLGIFYKIRRLEFLIRMFRKVIENVPDAKFYFIGQGEDTSVDKKLKNEAKRLNIEKQIIFTGYIPLEKALKYIMKATVCVSSYYPTFILNSTSPTKVIEYMAMGKAVVGNDHPEQKFLLTKSGGGICVSYNEDDFAKAVTTLLLNPDMALEMGQKGKLYIQNHRTYSIIADMLEKMYFKLL